METDTADPTDESADAEDTHPVEAEPETSQHLLDLSHSTRTYKTLISGGHFDLSTKSVKVIDPSLSTAFAQAVWNALTSEEAGGESNVIALAKGNGAFVLVELVEALKKAGKAGDVKRVLGGKKVRGEIETSGQKGAGLLAEKLVAL